MRPERPPDKNNKTVSVFIPCIVDQVYPEMGFAMVKILRHFGYRIKYNKEQTCCGQPAYNGGFRHESLKVASHFIDVFSKDDIIVGLSGSCVSMIRNHYKTLFTDQPEYSKAVETGKKTFEFSEFLASEKLIDKINGHFDESVGFHNSCHSLRELNINTFPFRILERISGLKLAQPEGDPVCCGFGGMFSFKYSEISESMAENRIQQFINAGANIIVSNDPGCIMHMRQEALDQNINIEIWHLTEFLIRAMNL